MTNENTSVTIKNQITKRLTLECIINVVLAQAEDQKQGQRKIMKDTAEKYASIYRMLNNKSELNLRVITNSAFRTASHLLIFYPIPKRLKDLAKDTY